MKKVALLLVFVGSSLVRGIVPSASASDPSTGFAFSDKVVLVYHYIWFQEDNWLKTATQGGRKGGVEGLASAGRCLQFLGPNGD